MRAYMRRKTARLTKNIRSSVVTNGKNTQARTTARIRGTSKKTHHRVTNRMAARCPQKANAAAKSSSRSSNPPRRGRLFREVGEPRREGQRVRVRAVDQRLGEGRGEHPAAQLGLQVVSPGAGETPEPNLQQVVRPGPEAGFLVVALVEPQPELGEFV